MIQIRKEDNQKKQKEKKLKVYKVNTHKLRILKSEPESEIELTITEGRFHQVKRMFEAVGKKVLYLKRISMGPLQLTDDLKPGEYRPLTEEEITALKTVNK